MNLKIIFSFLIVICSSLQAAAPATHVYFAQLWMDIHGIDDVDNQNSFITGTLFPDIRYLGTIKRNETHEKGITPEKIRTSPHLFKSGMRLHAYLDIERENVVKKLGISNHLKMIPENLRVLFLKTLEDEILWDQVHCQQVQQALSKVHLEEIEQGVTEEIVLEWHDIMIDYFNEKPSIFLKERARKGIGFLNADAKTIKTWSRLIPILAKRPVFVEYVNELITTMTDKFTEASN